MKQEGWNKREFLNALAQKLTEESLEFSEAKDKTDQIKELADIMEVLKTIMAELKINLAEVETVRQQREQQRGGFSKKVFLVSTRGGNYKR